MAIRPFRIFSGSAHLVLAIEVISIAAHLAEIIDLIHEGKSISPNLVLS